MSVWRRSAARAVPATPRPIADVVASLLSSSYQTVDLSTVESSMQSIAVRAAADLLASLASELPIRGYRGRGPQREELPRLPSYVLDPAGDGHGVEDWVYQLMISWLYRGNAYGQNHDPTPTGMLRQVELLHPDSVSASMEDGRPVWTANGADVTRRMVHRRVNPIPGVLLGLSPISAHMRAIKLSVTSSQFGLQWFQDGGHPSGILSNTEVDLADQNTAQTVKDRFKAALFGKREPLVLGRGWGWQQIQINPEESQFLETQGYSEAQCARIFGPGVPEILGYDTGGSMTYNTTVDRDISLLKYAANRWFRRAERFLSQFLPRPQYVEFDRDDFLVTNALQRWQVHQLEISTKAKSVNEIREKEGLPPVPWGDSPVSSTPPQGPQDPNGANAQ